MSTLHEVYERLLQHYGPQHWWPADSPLEVMLGAILTQNTSWKNVEKALKNLREADLMDASRLLAVAPAELEELLRPAGYFRQKVARIRNLLKLLFDRYQGELTRMFATDLETLRQELLALNGIGPETADSILLHAAGKPSFVIDTYTNRVMKRHGWIEYEADYHAMKDHFESTLERDVALYNEFHALLVRVGNQHCRKTPDCENCPLQPLLPESGMIEADW